MYTIYVKDKNYSTLGRVHTKEPTSFFNCNFSQLYPNTKVDFCGQHVVFHHCNLKNVDIQDNWELHDCLTGHTSYCSHIHPDWNKIGLKRCSVDCEHKTTKTFTIDGETVEVYTYHDTPK